MEAEMKMALQPPRDLRAETCRLVIWGLVLAMLAWAWRGAEMKPMALVEQGGNILTLISDFFPPDFTDWRMYVEEMIVTLHVAIWGTLLAVICAVPLGIMSSENIAPWWICQPVRRLMDAARAINEMVFAMMFVVAVGLGPFAGVLALWVHTTGTLAKLFSIHFYRDSHTDRFSLIIIFQRLIIPDNIRIYDIFRPRFFQYKL